MDSTNQQLLPLNIEIIGEGFPLVLLHGLGSSSKDWQFNVDALKKRYRLVMVDLPGHGQSRPAKDGLSITLIADLIISTLDEVGISKFHLLGLSLGGAVAYQLCLDHPDKVGRVIIVNAIPNYRLTNPTLIIQYILRSVLLNVLGMDAIAKIVSKKLFPNEDQTSLREYGYQQIRKASKKSYLKTMKALVQWSIEPQLSRINTPLLYIVSEHDSLANSYKDIVDKTKPNSTIHVISNAHHAVNIEYPEKFNKAVLDFLT